MIRLALRVCLLVAATAARVAAQPAPFYTPAVDIEVPAGSVVLRIERETPASMLKGYPLGARWQLVLAGFGDPIVLDGRPARTMAAGSGFTDVADARKRLLSRTDRRGNAVTITYDSQGRITAVTGPKNAALAFTLDRGGRVAAIRTPRGDVAYTYATENLTEVRVNGAVTRRYDYGTAIGPSRVDDANTSPVDISYDSGGRPREYRFADGATLRFEVDPAANQQRTIAADGSVAALSRGNPTELVDAASQRWLIEWDLPARTRTDTAPDGSVTRTTFDASDRVLSIVDAAGKRTEYSYDADGRLVTIVHPGDRRQTFEYDRFGSLTAEKLNEQLVRSFTYHQDGSVASARGLNWPERRYAYSTAGRLTAITMAMGGTTSFEYDARGNVIRETNAVGGVTQRAYDAQNRVILAIEPSGAEWKYLYDDRGRLSQLTDPVVGVRRLEYDGRGRLQATSDATGRTAFEYDAAGRLTRIARPGNQVDVVAYDARGNVVRQTAADGTAVVTEYDALGRVTREREDGTVESLFRYDAAGALTGQTFLGQTQVFERNPAGYLARIVSGASVSSFQYDAIGRLLSATDALGHARQLTYAADGSLASSAVGGGDEVLFSYDLEGRRTSTRRPGGGVDRFSYDAMGNVTAAAAPGSGEYRVAYDSTGRATSITSPAGSTVTQTWDPANRLTERVLSTGARQTFKYDAAGRLLESSDGPQILRYTYDEAGRVTQTEFVAAQKTVRSVLDERGRRRALIDGDGRESTYEYNDAAQVTAIRLPDGSRLHFTYDAAGRPRSLTYPNGVVATYEYEPRGDLARVHFVSAKGQALLTQEYRYDAVGNLTERRGDGGRITRYAYDAADQLIEERAGTSTMRVQYGPGGNRRSLVRDGVTTAYAHDAADRLLSAETVTLPTANRRGAPPAASRTEFSYDAGGALQRRVTGAAATAFTFDALERLISVRAADGTATVFEYSAEGDRLTRRDGAAITQFIYDGLDLIQEIDGKGQTIAAYTFAPGIDRPLAMWKGRQYYFFLADRDGSILAITDRQGNVVSNYEYDAFGNSRARKEGVTSPFGFTGRELDRATQLYFHRARYYDPALGRFLSVDPAAPDDLDVLSFNPYLYASNNPLRYADPLGLSPTPTAPYPSDVQDFVRAKLNELGTAVPEQPGARPRPGNPNPAIERVLAPAAEKGRTAQKTISKWPVRDGRDWKVGRHSIPGGPERFRVAPERAPKLREFVLPHDAPTPGRGTPMPGIANNAVTPGRGTPAPPSPPAPFSRPPAVPTPSVGAPFDSTRSLPTGFSLDDIRDELGAGARPPTGPGLRDSGFRSPTAGPSGALPNTPPTGTPAAPATVKPPITVTPTGTPASATPAATAVPTTPPTPAPGIGPVTAPTTARGSGAGSPTLVTPAKPDAAARPANDTLRTPRGPGAGGGIDLSPRTVLPIVLTVLQLKQCYDGGLSLGDCVALAVANQALVIGAVTVVEVVLQEVGTAGQVILGVARVIAPYAGVAAAVKVTIDKTYDQYELYLQAEAAVTEADVNAAQLVQQMRQRVRALQSIRQGIDSGARENDRIAQEVELRLAPLEAEIRALEPLASGLEQTAPACRSAASQQDELRRLRTAVQSSLADLQGEVGRLRIAVANCRSAEDVQAIYAAAGRAATLGNEVDRALQQATEARRQMLTEMARTPAPAAGPGLAEARATLRDLNRRLAAELTRIPGGSDDSPLIARHRESTTRLLDETAAARRLFLDADPSRAAWIINITRPRLVQLSAKFDDLTAEINEERRRMDDFLNGRAPAATPRSATVLPRVQQALRQVSQLEARLDAASCSFTDEDLLDQIRRLQFDAQSAALEAEQLALRARACTAGQVTLPAPGREARPVPAPRPPVDERIVPAPGVGGFTPAPRVLSALLDCGDVLELEAGGRTELCAVHVSGWDSSSRTPVEVLFRPPLPASSGVSVSPGDTSMGGDVMYGAGVQGRPDRYIFSQGWRADRAAPPGATAITVFVRQGSNVVRLPLTLNVIARRAPTGSSLEPPTPNVAGSGGEYCVWQYKLFGDPVGCWHLVAAGCTSPRYAGRPEYVLVGDNMTRSQADRRIGELSRYFDDLSCRADSGNRDRDRDPWDPPVQQPVVPTDPDGPPPAPPTPPPLAPPPGPVSRFSRFGIAPRDTTIKVGDAIELRAYATANGAPDMVLVLDEREVRWSGDRPPAFTATAADAGQSFRITATGPAGESDTVTIRVERTTTTTDAPNNPPSPATPTATSDAPVVGAPAPPGALRLVRMNVAKAETWRYGKTQPSPTSHQQRNEDGPNNIQDFACNFGGVPANLVPGQDYTITSTASVSAVPPTATIYYETRVNTSGVSIVGTPVNAYAHNFPGSAGKPAPSAGSVTLRVDANATSATIGLACYPGGTFATYFYEVDKK